MDSKVEEIAENSDAERQEVDINGSDLSDTNDFAVVNQEDVKEAAELDSEAGCKNNGVGTPLELASQTWTHMPSVATVAPPVQLLAVQHRADRERAREVGFVTQNSKTNNTYCFISYC